MEFTTPLKKNHEFKRLYSKGKSAASQYAVVYCKRSGKPENRLGIAVSKKLGGAVKRNRIRRRLKEVYRLNEKKLSIGYDIVLIARTRSMFARFHELESSVLSLFRKLKIINDASVGVVTGVCANSGSGSNASSGSGSDLGSGSSLSAGSVMGTVLGGNAQ